MTAPSKLTPSSSQTVGPYFGIGLTYLMERCPSHEMGKAGTITIQGRVLGRDAVPVPDAMLEFWSAEGPATSSENGIPGEFRRVFTDGDGNFSAVLTRPAAVGLEDGGLRSPHLLVLVFARGLLRHLISRVYFEDEAENESDPVLVEIPAERRRTLVAKRDGENSFRWNVVLQGSDETVFFAW